MSGPAPRERGPALAAAAAGAAVLALALGVVVLQERAELRDRRRAALDDAQRAARALEGELGRPLAAAHALAALVRRDGDVADFDRVCRDIIADYAGVSALQLAPGGVITRTYPLAGNEAAIGLDLFADPGRAAAARKTRDTRLLTLEGPFELRQGGAGMVGRIPIFRHADGAERFWGFVAVILRMPELLSRAHVAGLEPAGYAWALARRLPEPGPAFAGSRAPPGEDAVEVPVEVPNGAWVLRIAPRAGWARPGPRALRVLLALALAAAAGLATLRTLRQPEVLRRLVAERTAALDEANRRLAAELAERQRAEAARREAEEQARHAQKMEAIGLLAGGVAHDFNNLLTGILGYADALAEPEPPVAEAAQGIRQAAERAAALTRQLLGFARRGKYLEVPVDLHALVREVSGLLDRTVDKRIKLVQRLDAVRPWVRGDPGQLQQVVLNLAVNARDAMPEGGTLAFETRQVTLDAAACAGWPGTGPGDHVSLSVVDSGVGIPDEVRDRIFEPFFTTKAPGRGTGMGLAMVYGIVRNHGGSISFAPAEGGGTRFTVLLPADDGARAAAPGGEGAAHGAGRVLVVDDEPLVRSAAARLLAGLGYEVATAASADEALAAARGAAAPFDVALVDLSMPSVDGLDALRALRHVTPGLAAVLMTGYGRDGRVQEALDSGFEGFVQKPFGARELAAELERVLRQARAAPARDATTGRAPGP